MTAGFPEIGDHLNAKELWTLPVCDQDEYAAWRGMARSALIRFIEIVPEPVVEQATLPREESRGLCTELTLPGGAALRVYQLAGQGGAA